ncbi:hypothetical protein PAECIP111893_00917 [Paenibacillus plantiphilus]|uniref:DUF4184 domain-containing protein n=1 Tax=Paenibacillus plantiphilus TaxID=2905650 RepID=A0ABN8G658_9BACL|nr:DUF4184 family protein [Paenibacillus plantiphilus]CAH1197727.1 hypothetical protein PAECIP111893_00917 [Paenibacillus plantiphilus]
MPFTFSHPLFAVPLRRIAPKWLSVTGLVLGSMAPDMEYFMAMEPYRSIGHSLSGFLLLGLPLCIAIAYAFHMIMKPILPLFMPPQSGINHFVQHILNGQQSWQLRTAREWMVFVASLFIGFLTHLFMDSWTHTSGVFVKHFPLLNNKIAGEGIYHWLQYMTSVVGLMIPSALLLYRYWRWRSSVDRSSMKSVGRDRERFLLWTVCIAVATIMLAVKMVKSYGQIGLGDWIVAPLSAAMFGWFAASLLYAAIRRQRVGRVVILLVVTLVIMASYDAIQLQLLTWMHDLHRTITLTEFQQLNQLIWIVFCSAWAAAVIVSCRFVSKKG